MRIPISIEGRTCARRWLGAALVPLVLAACNSSGGSSHGEETPPPAESDPAIASTLPRGPALEIAAAASDAARPHPLDATPSPDGKTIYYAALNVDADGNRIAALYRTAAEGGAVDTLASGDPLSAPVGVTTSLDGDTVFVADPGAPGGGGILSVPAAGGAATVLAGTAGYRPQGITVAAPSPGGIQGEPRVYFTGFDPNSGDAGVFSVNLDGSDLVAIASGSPFGAPGGVAVIGSGDVFVADAMPSGGFSAVIKVTDGTAAPFVERIGVGFPAGISTTKDDSTLVVSGLDPATRTDAVYFVDVASGDLSVLTDTISEFHNPAGVHRAHDTDVFAWADSRAGESSSGTVYVLHP